MSSKPTCYLLELDEPTQIHCTPNLSQKEDKVKLRCRKFRRARGVIRNGWRATLEYDRESEQLVAKRIIGANQENTAELIIATREQHELTQLQFGKLVGVTDWTIRNWESGESYPEPIPMAMLKKALGKLNEKNKTLNC